MWLFKKKKSKKLVSQEEALMQIGYLVTSEINTNRKFRRQLDGTTLGKKILIIMQNANNGST